MHPLEVYYPNQAGRGLNTPGIGPVCSSPFYLQQGHGFGISSAISSTGSVLDCGVGQWAARRCVPVAKS